jgi:hypothetical protein
MHEQAGSYLADSQLLLLRPREGRCAKDGKQGKNPNAVRHSSASVSPAAISIVQRSITSQFAPQHERRNLS